MATAHNSGSADTAASVVADPMDSDLTARCSEARRVGAALFARYYPLSTEECFCTFTPQEVASVGGKSGWYDHPERKANMLLYVLQTVCDVAFRGMMTVHPVIHDIVDHNTPCTQCFTGRFSISRIRIFVRFYELFCRDPLLECLLDYNDPDVPRDPNVHGRRFGTWLLAR